MQGRAAASLGVWGRSVEKMRRWRIFSAGWPAMPARSPFPETEKKCPPEKRTFDVLASMINSNI